MATHLVHALHTQLCGVSYIMMESFVLDGK